MQYLAGALITALFFVAFGAGYYAGKKHRPKLNEADEQERLKAERLRKGFQQMMSYDVTKAVGKRVE